MPTLLSRRMMAVAAGLAIFASLSAASEVHLLPRQTTGISLAPASIPSPGPNFTILEAPNYLTAINETTANYTTVMVRDLDDQDLIYPLTYTLTSRREVLTYGDIIWGTEALLRELTVPANTQRSRSKRFYSRSPWAWPHATVIYRYDSCETKSRLGPFLSHAMAEWKSLAPYLNFVELAPLATFTPGVLLVTDAEPTNAWCWSNVGFWNGGSALRMNLQLYTNPDPVTGATQKTCGFSHATIMHELGHQLGLMHEQQRPDAAETVKFHCENYYDGDCPTQACCRDSVTGKFPLKDSGVDECCAGTVAFEPGAPAAEDVLGKPYDAKSIVQYPFWASSKGLPTLTLVSDGSIVEDNMGKVSKGDLETLCLFYKGYCDAWKAAEKAGSGCADNKCVDPGGEKNTPSNACGTCDLTPGKNRCHLSASCTNTGGAFHCMCRAGFKASGAANADVSKHFRLPWLNFEQIVFVAEGVECLQLCDFPHGISPQLCAEVPTQATCPL